jgi:hypothetical protein
MFTPGQQVNYYHAFLDRTFAAEVVAVHKQCLYITFSLGFGTDPVKRRLTLRSAEGCLTPKEK